MCCIREIASRHPGKLSSDKHIITLVLISVRKSLRLLEILDKAQGHACRNANASVVICGRLVPAGTKSACSLVATVRGQARLTRTGSPQQESPCVLLTSLKPPGSI